MISTGLTCIVDDSADFRFMLQQLFRHQLPGYPVLFFANGQALLDELPKLHSRPKLILFDRHMPGSDGHRTLVILKAHPDFRTIPMVMMSAEPNPKEIQGCYNAGASSFLIKKTDLAIFRGMIADVLHYWTDVNR